MKLHLPSLKLRPLNVSYIRQSWWKILGLGILLVVATSLSRSAYCVLGDCDIKDKWCKDDCAHPCGPTQGLGVIVGCSRGAYGCVEDWIPDAWGMRCTNRDDCNVTECASIPPGLGCYLVGEGLWDVGVCSAFPNCQRRSLIINETCCGSDSPTPCPKSGPTIVTAALQPTPEFPLVIGQDPDRHGITSSPITVTAGEHDCRTGTILIISVKIQLSSKSIGWINGELARKYPGAHVLDSYPISPVLTTTGLNTPTATASFHFDPKDPGDYEVTVTARQDDGQEAIKVFQVHVALYESTITH